MIFKLVAMVACGAIGYSNFSTRKKTIKVKSLHKVPTLDVVRLLKWLHAMKLAPLYPSDENFLICSLHFADNCLEQDLNVYVIATIIYNSGFCPFVFRNYALLKRQ